MSNATVNTYDAVGNLLSVTDPEGNETSYQYDRLDRQVTVTDPLGNTSTEEYDADGNVIQNVDRDGLRDRLPLRSVESAGRGGLDVRRNALPHDPVLL